MVLAPGLWFDAALRGQPISTTAWHGFGGLLCSLGFGYLLAVRAPFRYWPVLAVGLIANLFTAVVFLVSLTADTVPDALGWTVACGAAASCAPLFAILAEALRSHAAGYRYWNSPPLGFDDAIRNTVDQHGRSLADASFDHPIVLVFLRHSGCTFCREALRDLVQQRQRIEQDGARIALVHLARSADPAWLSQSELNDASRYSDPNRNLYRAFQLKRASWGQIFGPRMWKRAWQAARAGHGLGRIEGDTFQMPGAFLFHRGEIRHAYRHQHVGEVPDYVALAQTASTAA